MTKEDFIARLKEDKFFSNPKELIKYRLPVIQFYLTNFTDSIAQINNELFYSKCITIKYEEEDFTLINQAFESIKKQFIK